MSEYEGKYNKRLKRDYDMLMRVVEKLDEKASDYLKLDDPYQVFMEALTVVIEEHATLSSNVATLTVKKRKYQRLLGEETKRVWALEEALKEALTRERGHRGDCGGGRFGEDCTCDRDEFIALAASKGGAMSEQDAVLDAAFERYEGHAELASLLIANEGPPPDDDLRILSVQIGNLVSRLRRERDDYRLKWDRAMNLLHEPKP